MRNERYPVQSARNGSTADIRRIAEDTGEIQDDADTCGLSEESKMLEGEIFHYSCKVPMISSFNSIFRNCFLTG